MVRRVLVGVAGFSDNVKRLARDAVRDPVAWLLAGIVVAAGVAYGFAAVPFVLGGDAGEFATLFATGGIAHPPGYPTEVLWLRALHWIPCKTPAHGAASSSGSTSSRESEQASIAPRGPPSSRRLARVALTARARSFAK